MKISGSQKNNNFSIMLRKLRVENGLTQKELGNNLSLSRSAIAKYENDNGQPSKKIIRKMASHFHVSINYLLGKTNKKSYKSIIKYLLLILGSTFSLLFIVAFFLNINFYSPRKLIDYYSFDRHEIDKITVIYQNQKKVFTNDESIFWLTNDVVKETMVTPRYFISNKSNSFLLTIDTYRGNICLGENYITLNEKQTYFFNLQNKHLFKYYIEHIINK